MKNTWKTMEKEQCWKRISRSTLAFLPQAGFPSRYQRFVETGTFLGQTVVQLSKHFSELHSIAARSTSIFEPETGLLKPPEVVNPCEDGVFRWRNPSPNGFLDGKCLVLL